jgi:hypothetical protein
MCTTAIKSLFLNGNHLCEQELQEIQQELDKSGIIFLKNINSEIKLLQIIKFLGSIDTLGGTKEEITNIEYNPSLPGKGYTREALFLHTDRSPVQVPPKYLLTFVKGRNGAGGGETTFADGLSLHRNLKEVPVNQ